MYYIYRTHDGMPHYINGQLFIQKVVEGLNAQLDSLVAAGILVKEEYLMDYKESVRAATTMPLPDVAYNNGVNGVGATLSEIIPNVLPPIDGVLTLANGDRILVKDQVDQTQNGIYEIVDIGYTAPDPPDSRSFVLRRTVDCDESLEISSGFLVVVTEGTVNIDLGFLLTTTGNIVVGTTPLTFAPFGSGGGGTTDHSALLNLGWAACGHTVGDDVPIYLDTALTRSVMWNTGVVGFAFNDSVYITGGVQTTGFFGANIQITSTDPYPVTPLDHTVLLDGSMNAVNVILPPAAMSVGRILIFKALNIAFAVAIIPAPMETIDGAPVPYVFAAPMQTVRLQANPMGWWII